MTNLTPLELTELKPFLVKAMGMMQGLAPRRDEEEEEDEGAGLANGPVGEYEGE